MFIAHRERSQTGSIGAKCQSGYFTPKGVEGSLASKNYKHFAPNGALAHYFETT